MGGVVSPMSSSSRCVYPTATVNKVAPVLFKSRASGIVFWGLILDSPSVIVITTLGTSERD
jgi:hypothetical protein